MVSPLIKWDSQGTPYSVIFDDMYFCAVNGYEDALYIFCKGNRLEERFKKLDPAVNGVFTIVETGFGTGLIFCVAWKLWTEHAPPSWTLNFLSIEKYPLPLPELEQALSVWPIVKPQADELVVNYKVPPDKAGVFNLEGGRVKLTIIFDDIVPGLGAMAREGRAAPGADALFLDGFSPAKNPEMWTEDVFAGLACLSRSGTTLATFTVAGWVRRGLESQGFRIQKVTGYGCKNQMLEGYFLKENNKGIKMNNIFVGNLSFQATKEDVVKLFEPFGTVAHAVIMERKKGKSRGYGFVDMPNEEEKNTAIAALQGKEFMWRVLSVSPVIPKVKGEAKSHRASKPGGKSPSSSQPYRRDDQASSAENTGEGASKYYSKFDGPPKPWRKVNKDSKTTRKDEGSRPYYGKKDKKFEGQSKTPAKREEVSKFSNKPKSGKGFKMFHKVSGASKIRPKKD